MAAMDANFTLFGAHYHGIIIESMNGENSHHVGSVLPLWEPIMAAMDANFTLFEAHYHGIIIESMNGENQCLQDPLLLRRLL